MKKKDAEAIQALAQSMDWDALALTIIELGQELHELKDLIDKKELKDRLKELQIYEITKEHMVRKLSTSSPSIPLVYGEDYASIGNDEDESY